MKETGVERTEADPKGLVRESYRIDGISLAECRSIFLDWALSLADGADASAAIVVLLDQYGRGAPDHPMTGTLRAGLAAPQAPKRRGGRMGRASEQGDFSAKNQSDDFSTKNPEP